ncbi:DUF2798 domain-containing protein [Pseudoalteromonas sp. ZZD1]|uniref:DUF2798 domain-containing protein n=1 Tax=Pseudoalteromonas sp. ZZD1 TaxID=3139395 RepID=UPI003BAA21E2
MAKTLSITQSSNDEKTPVIYKIIVVFSILLTIGGTLTGVMTYMNVGFNDAFYTNWLTSFIAAVTIMIPVGVVMMALLTKLINKLMPMASKLKKDLLIGGCMAIIMESVMSFATAFNNIGFNDFNQFTQGWLQGFLAALPIGLTMMLIMTMTLKPKIEQFMKS